MKHLIYKILYMYVDKNTCVCLCRYVYMYMCVHVCDYKIITVSLTHLLFPVLHTFRFGWSLFEFIAITHTHKHILYVYTYTHIYYKTLRNIYMYTYTYIYIHIYMYTYAYICIYTHIYICTYIHTYIMFRVYMCMQVCLVAQSCRTLCNPMDCSWPSSSVHEISQTRILEWVAISFSKGSSQPRNQT